MKVLLAEDQAPARLFLRRLLGRLDHDVTPAAAGDEAGGSPAGSGSRS